MRCKIRFDVVDADTDDILTGPQQITIALTEDDLKALAHVKRGKFLNAQVQQAFLACVHYVRQHYKTLVAGGTEEVTVSKDIHGSYTDVKPED